MIRGLGHRFLLASFIIVGVAVITGAMAFALAGDYEDPFEAVWWAFLRLSDPGYLGDDEGFARRSVSTLVTVLGYVLFLGMLVAILTQWLNQKIAKLESGFTPVVLSDHVVVLGWTHQTRPVVDSLLHANARVKRFLARRGARDLHVVIMAEEVDDALRQRFLERFGEDAGRRVLLRAGTPLRIDHLERVAYRDAAVIILPGPGISESKPEHCDSATVKTLASVSRLAAEHGSPPPFAVAEIFDVQNVSLARQAYRGDCELIAADGMISRLVAQCVRHRGLWGVLAELFMQHEGNGIHVRQVEDQDGQTFGELGPRFPLAILLGVVRPRDTRALLNPDPDLVLEAEDTLVFLARRHEDCVPGPRRDTQREGVVAQQPLRPLSGARRVLVLGWSRKVPGLFRELQRLDANSFEIEIVSGTPVALREAQLDRHLKAELTLSVKHLEAGYSRPDVIEELEPESYDNIVVLASERFEDKEHADAISVAAALRLRGCLAGQDGPEVMVELLDDENLSLFRGGHEDVIVSPAVVSYVVSQVALRRELASVFWELTGPRGGQIVLQPAASFADAGTNGTLRFDHVQQIAAAHGDIALGFRRPTDPDDGLVLNPDRETDWSIEPGDEVVVLTSIEAPPG